MGVDYLKDIDWLTDWLNSLAVVIDLFIDFIAFVCCLRLLNNIEPLVFTAAAVAAAFIRSTLHSSRCWGMNACQVNAASTNVVGDVRLSTASR